ncbi:helix-turn-helix domain-containing protein, partial [Citrobacter amalonaticus]|uniref:helix-turn-helix domain-containing protein n=1 Tax=Citrobacter amalonaticus TaxID=35703 RepID=UPI00300C52AA
YKHDGKGVLSPGKRRSLFVNDIQRPTETIQQIHDALKPFSAPCSLPPNRTLHISANENDHIWLLHSGSCSVLRTYDDLKIGVFRGPLVIGLQEMFVPFGRHYFQFSSETTISSLASEQARKVLTEQGLWEQVALILAYYMRLMTYRDEHLVAQSSYTAIRVKLIEYMTNRELLAQKRIGLAAFIQATTFISRSQIYYVLSVLTQGGYIRVSRGKLEEIIHLPENF